MVVFKNSLPNIIGVFNFLKSHFFEMQGKGKIIMKKKKLIPFSIAKQTLILNQKTFDNLIKDKKIKIYKNDNLDSCILDSDLKSLCYDKKVINNSKKDILANLLSFESDKKNKKDEILIQKIKELLKQYRKDIKVLERIHKKYINNVDILNDDTALVAAYILFAKVINLLNMVCLCLEKFYFHSCSLLRIIDETIDVAEYFIISEGTEKGDLALKTWFREDFSPSNSICREELSKYMGSIIQNKPEANKELLDTLYQLKSKMIHPTRSIIFEGLIYSGKEGISLPNSFDYKRCSYIRRIYKLVDFFKSSIQTAFQGFFFCFYKKMPLEKGDKDILIFINDKYEKNNRFAM